MSWHLKLSKLSDVLYGDDSARIRSFESAISIASPRDNSDHLLSLGTRLLQKTNKEATTNPAAIKRLTEVLTNSAPNLLESIPCDYSRFYSTHSIGEVVLGLGDLGEDPKLALKIYEKMHSLSHPKDCKHFEVTAQKEAKAYHAINAQEIQTLYASDNHPAVLEKIGIGTEAFNTLYIEKREKLFTLIIQLERDMQFKAAFQCYQFLNTGKLNENNQALHYMTKALLNNNYEEAIFLLNISAENSSSDTKALFPFIEALENCSQKEYQSIAIASLLNNQHSAYRLLNYLIYLPNLQNILFQDQDLRQKLFNLVLKTPDQYSRILSQIQGYLIDNIHDMDQAALNEFIEFYEKMGIALSPSEIAISFYEAAFQCLMLTSTPLSHLQIGWFEEFIQFHVNHNKEKAISFLKEAIESVQVFAYQLPLNDTYLDFSSYLHEHLLKLAPEDPHVLFSLGMQRKFYHLLTQKNNPGLSTYTQKEFKEILELLLKAYKFAKGTIKGVCLAAIGDTISDAMIRNIPISSQEQQLLEESKKITSVYALPEYAKESLYENAHDSDSSDYLGSSSNPIPDLQETRMDKFVEKFKKAAQVRDIADDLEIPSENDPRFGIWETYKQISSYINEIIYPDFSHVNDLTFPYFFHINDNPQLHMFDIENPERKKIPSKDEIPNIYGDYTLKAPPPDEPKYKIDFSLPAEERIEQRIAENKHAIAEKCGL